MKLCTYTSTYRPINQTWNNLMDGAWDTVTTTAVSTAAS